MNKEKIHIGTSGWHYEHWQDVFYPPGVSKREWLKFYAQIFHTVEINSTFYHIPKEKTLGNWYSHSPDDFIFSIKANKLITHIKKLKDIDEPLEEFLLRTRGLKGKLGAILFQLPPSLSLDLGRLREFATLIPKDLHAAVEFRDLTWHTDETCRILTEKNIAFCIFELAGKQSPLVTTADFVYIRLHGPAGAYQGDYSDEALQKWAERIIQWENKGKEVYFYFDNDEKGYAPKNATRLIELIATLNKENTIHGEL